MGEWHISQGEGWVSRKRERVDGRFPFEFKEEMMGETDKWWKLTDNGEKKSIFGDDSS